MPASSTPTPVDVEALVKAGVLRRAKDGVRLLGTASSRARWLLRSPGVEIGGGGGREGGGLGRDSGAEAGGGSQAA